MACSIAVREKAKEFVALVEDHVKEERPQAKMEQKVYIYIDSIINT